VSSTGPSRKISIDDELKSALAGQLPEFLKRQRWFGAKARTIEFARVTRVIGVPSDRFEAYFLIVDVEFASGAGETYVLPVIRVQDAPAGASGQGALKVRSESGGGELQFTDALSNSDFLWALLDVIGNNSVLQGATSEIHGSRTQEFLRLRPVSNSGIQPKLLKGEQSNSSIVYGDRLILKIIRRLEEGINPDLEMLAFLSEEAHFKNVPPLAGSLEYQPKDGNVATLGILQGFVPNKGDAWRFTMDALAEFWEEVGQSPAKPSPQAAQGSIGAYLDATRTLARRTAELHMALASAQNDPAFTPERFTSAFQHVFESSALELVQRNFGLLREKLPELPANVRPHAEELLARQGDIERRFKEVLREPIQAMRTRIHGDYHLGQVLYTGNDFIIIDFEGEPSRHLTERRIKRSPLNDVAGMIRSFHYAPYASLLGATGSDAVREDQLGRLIPWAEAWAESVTAAFLQSYLDRSGAAAYLPPRGESFSNLLEIYLLEKAIYELGYELNNRPTWVGIPIAGIAALLKSERA
jgi:maltose alpha-D-glucosyltransferase/alpha-amylase